MAELVYDDKVIYTQEIPGWDNPPAVGNLAVLRLDLGKRYHNVVITSPTTTPGTDFGTDTIEYVAVKINGREQRRFTPAQLHAINKMYQRGGLSEQYDDESALVIWFEEPWSCEQKSKDALCLGTGDLQIVTIEFQIKSGLESAPVLVGYWTYDKAMSAITNADNSVSLVPAKMGQICRWINYTPELSQGQNRKRNLPLNGLWRAIYIFENDKITGAEVIVNNQSVIKINRNNFALLQKLFNIVDQNGMIAIFPSRAREDYGIQNSETKNVELVLECSEAISPQCLIDTVGGVL